ncbi:MAG TPA: hypothetical protein VFP87_04080, partial [Chitinophagaceae bacterium]|nr:hypothetical protein [Chitinophagaceae bacterium]
MRINFTLLKNWLVFKSAPSDRGNYAAAVGCCNHELNGVATTTVQNLNQQSDASYSVASFSFNTLNQSSSQKFYSMKTLSRFLLITVSVIALTLCSSFAFGQATVTTDQLDYPPGGTVIITGSGFQAGETVTLQVLHTLTNGDNDTSAAHQPWTAVADENGNISSTWTVPLDQDELGATLKLTADGQTSGLHAETTFTDAPRTDTYPSTFTSFTGGTTYCLNGAASNLTAAWNNTTCNGTQNGSNTNIAITITWYRNSTNSTSGGTAVQTTNTNASTVLSSYLPPTNATGDSYYYVVISWSAGPNCALASSITTVGTQKVTVNPLPTVFNMGFTGSLCSTATFTLSGSEVGVNYALTRGTTIVQTLAGTGSSLTFSATSTNGTYSIVATNATTNCQSTMNNTFSLGGGTPPTAFSVTGGGSYCTGGSGVAVGLSGS